MKVWEGVIGYEARPTVDGRAIDPGVLTLSLPVPLYRIPNDESDFDGLLVGSIKTVDRHNLGDAIELWATGALLDGSPYQDGDTICVGLDVRIGAHEARTLDGTVLAGYDLTAAVRRGRPEYVEHVTVGHLLGGHVTDSPAWPGAVVHVLAKP